MDGMENSIVLTPEQQTLPELVRLRAHEMPERRRQIMTLRFLEGKSLEETAQQLGLPREWVRRIEYAAVRTLTHARIRRRKKIADFYK